MAPSTRSTKAATTTGLTTEDGNPLKVLAKIRIKDLKVALDDREVSYEDDGKKSYLTALYALAELDLLDVNNKVKSGEDALREDALLRATETWCLSPVKDLAKDIRARGLDENGNKWNLVRDLILVENERLRTITKKSSAKSKRPARKRKEIQDEDDSEEEKSNGKAKTSKKAKLTQEADTLMVKKTRAEAKTSEKGKEVEKVTSEIALIDAADEGKATRPSLEMMNFLLYIIHAHLERNGDVKLLPNCPIKVGPQLQNIIEGIPTLKTYKQISELPEKQKETMDWIGNTFGDLLTLASNDLVIPGLNKNITQFIFNSPMPTIHDQFTKQVAAKGGKSKVLFHGTPTSNLLSMLRTKIRPSAHENGLWTALEPATSFGYAFKSPSATYSQSAHSSCGVLLGLEVAGEGNLGVVYDGINVIQQIDSIMIRYVFVLPRSLLTNPVNYSSLSTRAITEPAMKKAFKKIEESLSGEQE